MDKNENKLLRDAAATLGLIQERTPEFKDARTRAARRMGAVGGRTPSEAKAEAARVNGKKGGRPRKVAPAKTEIDAGF